MTEPSTCRDQGHNDNDQGYGYDMTPNKGSAMEPLQDRLAADELPLSEDDYALAIQSSRSLLRQINDRRHLSQHRRQPPRQRPRNTDTGSTRSVEKLSQGLNRQNLHQSPLRSCVNSRCISATLPSSPSSTRTWELDAGKRTTYTMPQRESRPGKSHISTSSSAEVDMEPSTKVSLGGEEHIQPASMSTEEPLTAPYEADSSGELTSPTLLIADSDEDMDEDEGYFEGTDDLLRLGEDSNESMQLLGAYRRRGLLRFRRSTEAATTCPVVVRNVPRMRRRKQKKMEVRQRAATTPDDNVSARGANTAIE